MNALGKDNRDLIYDDLIRDDNPSSEYDALIHAHEHRHKSKG